MPTIIRYDGVLLTDPENGILATMPEDMGTPPIRGQNINIPFRHGSVTVQKFYDARQIVLNGYVYGRNRLEVFQRMDTLKKLFSVAALDYRPKKLEIEWPDGTKRYVYAEVANTMGFQGTHTTHSPFSIQLVCADPFWHDDSAAQEKPYRLNDPRRLRLGNPDLLIADFDSSYDNQLVGQTETFTVPNPGVLAIEDAVFKFRFQAPGGNFTITCGGTTFTVNHPHGQLFNAGNVVIVDCGKYSLHIDDSMFNRSLITPLGQRSPLIIPTGEPAIVFSSTTADNSIRVSIKYAALYL